MRILAAVPIAVLLFVPASASALPLGNLLANPGAEDAPSGGSVLPSWQVTGAFTAIAYSAPGSPPPPTPESGNNYMHGGEAAVSTATQEIDLSDAASDIDAGRCVAGFSAHLGGFEDHGDNAGAVAVWLDGSRTTELGRITLAPALAAERGNQTRFINRADGGRIPAGSRWARVILTATRERGFNNDGFVDNVSLSAFNSTVPASGGARTAGFTAPCGLPPARPQPRSVTQPRGSCGNAPGQQVCIGAPADIRRFGCTRRGSFVHRFRVKLKKRRGGLIVNRRSRVQVVAFSLDGRASGSDRRRPYLADVDGSVLGAGAHTLRGTVRLRIPGTERRFVKRLRFAFKACT
jgi:hypothetical protein